MNITEQKRKVTSSKVLFKRLSYMLLSASEGYLIHNYLLTNRHPPLFIVGAPRSGTTLVYLYVVNSLRFGYIPNISKNHPLACATYAALGRLLHTYTATYKSSYGQIEGITAPSDGWDVFHRWFPRYDYSQLVDIEHLHELKSTVRLLEQIYQAPFANKNNSNSVRINHLFEVFPTAFFIHVTRDIRDATDSLLDAREQHQVNLNEWWGVPPPQFSSRKFDNELEQAVFQILGVDLYIKKSFEIIPKKQKICISYENFCRNQTPLRQWLIDNYKAHDVNIECKQHPSQLDFSESVRSHTKQMSMQVSIAVNNARAEAISSSHE